MRIYRERIPSISKATVDELLKKELIEVVDGDRGEVDLDIESVLREYRRRDYELTERAKDIVATQSMDSSRVHRVKARLAKEAQFGLYDDAIDYLVRQMIEILLQSNHVEDIYGSDQELIAAIAPVLKRELNVESELDREVRARIKNLQEGTVDYDIEFQKTMEQIRAARRLDD